MSINCMTEVGMYPTPDLPLFLMQPSPHYSEELLLLLLMMMYVYCYFTCPLLGPLHLKSIELEIYYFAIFLLKIGYNV